jgi:NAD(P)-dependent dehydrogenase (short-subunit alcohol dehydrogenase family)
MVHWLASVYAKKGITVNGIAPALIQDTKMLPGSTEELSKSRLISNHNRSTWANRKRQRFQLVVLALLTRSPTPSSG